MPRRRKPLVPEAQEAMQQLKKQVMVDAGYDMNGKGSEDVKYEVAKELGIPLQKGYNGRIHAQDAGQIGGEIGGRMVKEMIRLAQEQLARRNQ